jgi:hypothetical protein
MSGEIVNVDQAHECTRPPNERRMPPGLRAGTSQAADPSPTPCSVAYGLNATLSSTEVSATVETYIL